jgi:hypothetical protein
MARSQNGQERTVLSLMDEKSWGLTPAHGDQQRRQRDPRQRGMAELRETECEEDAREER